MGVASLDLQQTDAGQGKIDYSNIVNKPKINGVTLEGNLATEDLNIVIPKLVSELQNDAGYITKNVDDLVSYYDKTEVDNMISTIPKFSIRVVDELPTEDISPTTIYLLRVEGDDHFEEWVYIDNEWDKLGDGNIDLSDYATYEYVDAELAKKANAADLATVALSGRYSDLIGTPTNLSQFTNDVGYLTEVPDGSVSRAKLSSALNADLTDVENVVDGLQNSVRSLSDTKADKTTVSALSDTVALKADKSELPTKTSDLTNDSGFITSADVPTKVSELTNDSGYITSAALSPYSTTQQMNTAISNAVANKADRNEIPTKVSDLTNDSGFVNSTQVNAALAAYTYPSQDLYTQSDIDTMLAQISSLKIEVVNALPQTGSADTIYLLRVRQQGNDIYQEYFWVNNAWELIGGIDLTDYYTKTEVNTLLTAKADVSAIPTKTSDLTNDSNFAVDANYVHTDNNYTTAEKNKLAGIAAGAEVNVQSNWTQTNSSADDFIKNKPSIPTKTSDITNDSGFITSAAIPTNVSAFNNDAGYLDEIPDDSVGLNQLDDTIVNALNNINNKANTADLAAVAFSGDYDDLTDKPIIPAAQVNSDWNASSGIAQILNKPTLATVATSGSYNDLSNKPTIPTVNNATLTIQKNGTNVQTFTANSSSNKTANITVPTATSELTNDSNFVTSTDYASANDAGVVKVGAGLAISSGGVLSATGGGTADAVAWGHITGTMADQTDLADALAAKVNSADLATVAISGSYNDLSNKPTNVSAFTNDAGYITSYTDNKTTQTLTRPTTSTTYYPVASASSSTNTADVKKFSGVSLSYSDNEGGIAALMLGQTGFSGSVAGSISLVDSVGAMGHTTIAGNGKNSTGNHTLNTPDTSGRLVANSSSNSATGSATNPIYADGDGVLHATTYTLEKSVPSNAVFTDTTYSDATTSTAGLMSAADKTKLNGIATGAEANVQSDWSITSSTSDAFIKNKPTKLSQFTNDSGFITGYTETDPIYSASPAAGITAEDIESWDNKSDFSGSYNDLTNKPTIGNATLTIQKNGTAVDTFTANATSNKTINITVPTTAADVSALPASTKYGAGIAVTVDTTNYKVTTTLRDQDGNTLGTAQVIDLPLESVVVNGSYDNTNKKIVLALQNGNTIDIPVADLVAGLQTEITSTNKLSSDLVDDTNHTHKFVTAAQITKLNGIATGAEVNVQSDWSVTDTTSDAYIKNKPTIPTVNNATLTIQKNGTNVQTFTANQSTNATANITVPTKTSELTNDSSFVTSSGTIAKANQLTTPRTIAISGGATGTATSFNGTSNISIPITDMKDAYVTWGGKSLAANVTPDDMGCIDEFGHNKLAFLPAECITVEYTTDGGTTWTDYGATDAQKIRMVSTTGTSFMAGGPSAVPTADNIADFKVRVRVASMTPSGTSKLYSAMVKCLLNITTNGASGTKVAIRSRTVANYRAGVDTWVDRGEFDISGWSGWNSIPFNYTFGGTNDSQLAQFEFVFWGTGKHTSYNSKVAVIDIRMIGRTNWTTPSEMARAGHLYTVNESQDATFPAKVIAPKIETGTGANNYFQSQKFRGQGDASSYYHAIDFGYGGHDQVDFYEYGGAWNFWRNTSSTATSDTANLALGIGIDALKNKSYTYTFPNKTGTFALTSDIPTVPTNVSAFTNDAGYLTSIPTASASTLGGIKVGSGLSISNGVLSTQSTAPDWSDITNKPTFATVATSGSYNDLSNKPTIPAAVTVDSALSSTSTNPVQNKVINTALSGKQASLSTAQLNAANSGITAAKVTTYDGYAGQIAGKADLSALDNKQDELTAGDHIDITNNTISATGYVHSENPVTATSSTATVTGSMIANGTITADKLATGATLKLTLSTTDIGEGAALAANTLYGVYR